MGGLQRLENKLEQMISGAFARAFRSAVQPVEIAAALQRECDNNAQILSRDRRLVPNDFHVELSGTDLERLAPYDSALADDLVRQLRDHADEQSYVFPGPVSIVFDPAEDLTTGRFRIRSRAQAKVTSDATATQVGPGRGPSSRSTAPDTRCRRPGWSSAAAPRPTCASTTPASAGGTSSSSSPAAASAASPSRSTTSARPTGCSSTVTGSPPPACRTAPRCASATPRSPSVSSRSVEVVAHV